MNKELMEAQFQDIAARVRRQGASNGEGSQVIFNAHTRLGFSRLVYWPPTQETVEELKLIQSFTDQPLPGALVGTTQVIALGRTAEGIVPIMSQTEDIFDIASGATFTRGRDYKIPSRSRQRAAKALLNTIENAIFS